MLEFDDKPIDSPEKDKFGFKPLAETIAKSITKMTKPEGTVIAINGPWGSGKSSLINLVRGHLDNSSERDDLKIIDFKCWWFRGQEALTIAFFYELYSAMKLNMSGKAKKVIPKLVPQLLIGASLVVDSVAGIPGITPMTSSIAKRIKQDETVEKLHKELSDTLNQDSKRYLVVIDDIDRLTPEEAILIFQLVKSVGGLPNVMYLLAYDRQLAEKIVSERYPSEGPHYLEKIVQAPFDLPEPSRVSLGEEFLRRLHDVIEEEEFRDDDDSRDLFAGMIFPEIKTPRDLVRLLNPLKVTWPSVKGEVDPTEFLCLETLRVQRPKLYATLRANKSLLTRGEMERAGLSMLEESQLSEEYNKIFLETEPQSEHERLRDGLMRLFPELKRVWLKADPTDLPADRHVQRRVCSPRHFDTYFRFSPSEHQIKKSEIESLIQRAADFDDIRGSLLAAAKISQPDDFTRATHLLRELVVHRDYIPKNRIGDLLKAIYSTADELIEKEGRNASKGTMRQLNSITHRLIIGRLPLERRPDVLRTACGQAALGYLVCIATSAYNCHFPTEGNRPNYELTTRDHAVELKDLAVTRIREARDNSSLINCPLLDRVLFLWIGVDEEEVRSWINAIIGNDVAVARLAKAFISMIEGDLVRDSEMQPAVALRRELEHVVDLDEFVSHADRAMREGNLEAEDREALNRFLEAWHR